MVNGEKSSNCQPDVDLIVIIIIVLKNQSFRSPTARIGQIYVQIKLIKMLFDLFQLKAEKIQ